MPAPATTSAKPFNIEAAEQAVGVRPETAVNLMRMSHDEATTNEDMEKVVDADPSMAMRTLKLANSSFYGMANRIARIDRAITMLGRATIAKLAASASIENAFAKIKIDAPNLTPQTPWIFSASVAFAAETIVNECPNLASVAQRKLAADSFVVGLIHDIGVLVQAKLANSEFSQAVTASINSGVPLIQHERRLIGIDHAEIGMRLAEHWSLPEELAQGIGFHHDPLAADTRHKHIACITHVTMQLVRKSGVAAVDGDTDMPHLEHALDFLRIDPRRVDKLTTIITTKLKGMQF